MLRNYILVAIRNLARNKFFSAINILGLAVSMSICMAIIMLVADQMMYDRYNTNRDRIYRVISYGVDMNGLDRGHNESATSPMPLKQELLENYTGIERAVRIKRGFGNGWLEFENQNVNIPIKGFFADPEVFDFFQYEFLYGDAKTALDKPYTVVLTQKAARKLFKEENPIGQTIKVGEIGTYTVTGVLKETKNKSHIVFEALASMASVKSLEAEGKFGKELDDWLNSWNGWTYIQLKPEKNTADFQAYFDKIFTDHIKPLGNQDTYRAKFRLQSLMEITPGSLIGNPIGPSLPWAFVYFLGGLAGIVMLTSCFNFTNLSMARSLKRAKEIGVRKVTGAARWQIFLQFLSESIVISLCALFCAFILLIIVKPLMLQLNFARIFMWDLEANYVVFAVFFVFALVVGILAGMFPAIVLSGFQPVKVLKSIGDVKLFSRMGLRKSLLVAQFTISLIFILSVILMYNQVFLFMHKEHGFNMKENMMVRLNNTSVQGLKTELLKHPNIKSVSAVSHVPAAGTTNGTSFKKDLAEKEWTAMSTFVVDEDYLKNMEINLLTGKFFLPENGESNKRFIVINEEAVKALHYKNSIDAIGEEIITQYDSSKKQIVGVVKNYNHDQLFSKIEPMALLYAPNQYNLLQVRYSGTREQVIKTIESSWAQVNPGLKVDYKEVEEEIKFFYNTVFGDAMNVLGVVAGLAIMISCLGLLGMATYTIETRMKEISIRKVLGSTDGALVFLLSRGFLKLLIVSIVLGVPGAWLLNSLWLEVIAYHTSLSAGVVLVGVSTLLLFGVITIGSQTLRAAFTNPVDNLKNE